MASLERIPHMSKEEVLYHLLSKERGYYKAIMDISRQEAEKLANRDIPEIKPLLQKKKVLLARIKEIETALIPLKKYWRSKLDKSDLYSIKIQKELGVLNVLLQEILEMDRISQKTLKNHLLDLEKNRLSNDS